MSLRHPNPPSVFATKAEKAPPVTTEAAAPTPKMKAEEREEGEAATALTEARTARRWDQPRIREKVAEEEGADTTRGASAAIAASAGVVEEEVAASVAATGSSATAADTGDIADAVVAAAVVGALVVLTEGVPVLAAGTNRVAGGALRHTHQSSLPPSATQRAGSILRATVASFGGRRRATSPRRAMRGSRRISFGSGG